MSNPTPDGDVRGFCFSLQRDAGGRLGLHATHHPQYGAVQADWCNAEMRRRAAAGRRQPLARALGLQRRTELRVCDATGGLGRDAFVIAALGATVTLVERQPQIVELLRDAHQRALDCVDTRAAAARIEIVQADAADWLAERPPFDAIYLDPMYPQDGKAALPSKEMQLLRELTGGDADAARLLAIAVKRAPRVAVKRPRSAPPLGARPADAEIRATQVRYDLYLQPAAAAARAE